MLRARLVSLAASLLLVVGAGGLSFEVIDAFGAQDPMARVFPSGWLPGVQRAEELGAFLVKVDQRLPAGAYVAVGSDRLGRADRHYLRMWVAYYLPRHRVVPREHLGGDQRPAYLLSYPGLAGPTPGMTELLRDTMATVHRLESPR